MSIRASFYSSIHQGWLAREVYILPFYLSPENWPDSFFFHCCLTKLVSGCILGGRPLESCICWYSLLAFARTNRDSLKENHFKNVKKPKKTTQKIALPNKIAHWVYCLVFLQFSPSVQKPVSRLWVEMFWKIIQGHRLWLLRSKNIGCFWPDSCLTYSIIWFLPQHCRDHGSHPDRKQ